MLRHRSPERDRPGSRLRRRPARDCRRASERLMPLNLAFQQPSPASLTPCFPHSALTGRPTSVTGRKPVLGASEHRCFSGPIFSLA